MAAAAIAVTGTAIAWTEREHRRRMGPGLRRRVKAMDLSGMTLFDMARRKMSWLGQRQAVLAQNIANSDTPGYRTKELEAIDFRRELSRLEPVRMAATSGSHPSGTVVPPEHRVETDRLRDVFEGNPDGQSGVRETARMSIGEGKSGYGRESKGGE